MWRDIAFLCKLPTQHKKTEHVCGGCLLFYLCVLVGVRLLFAFVLVAVRFLGVYVVVGVVFMCVLVYIVS